MGIFLKRTILVVKLLISVSKIKKYIFPYYVLGSGMKVLLEVVHEKRGVIWELKAAFDRRRDSPFSPCQ